MALSAQLIHEIRATGNSANGGAFRGTASVGTPSAPAVTGASTGGTVAANTYYVVITYTPGSDTRMSPISAQTSVTVTGATSKFTVTHPIDPGNGTTWNVYVGTVSGGPYFPQGTGLAIGSDRVVITTPPTTGTQPPGIDYSQQDAAQISFIDLVIGGTNTTVTSAAFPFTPAYVGNLINITSGTGFTVQRVEITGVTAAGVATVDKSLGTISSTGGVGKLGGALDHPAVVSGFAVDANIIFDKYDAATPHLFTSGTNVSGGTISMITGMTNGVIFQGYDTNRTLNNTDANRPIWRANAASIAVVGVSNAPHQFNNIVFDNPGGNATTSGINHSGNGGRVSRCKFIGFRGSSLNLTGQAARAEDCDITGAVLASGGHLILSTGSAAIRCIVRSCTGASPGFTGAAFGTTVEECIADSLGGTGFDLGSNYVRHRHCTSRNNTGDGFLVKGGSSAEGCLSYGNTGYGYNNSGADQRLLLANCRGGGNGTADYPNTFRIDQVIGFVHLTADPFINAAGGDLSLNNTVGAGADCRGQTIIFPNGTTTSYPDAGASQHADPAPVSTSTYLSF